MTDNFETIVPAVEAALQPADASTKIPVIEHVEPKPYVPALRADMAETVKAALDTESAVQKTYVALFGEDQFLADIRERIKVVEPAQASGIINEVRDLMFVVRASSARAEAIIERLHNQIAIGDGIPF